MANEIAKLVVAFEAQSAQYVKTMEALKQQNQKFHNDTVSTVSKVKAAFSTLAVAYSIERVTHFIEAQVDAVAQIGKVAAAAGLGAEQMQRLSIAFAELTGISQQQVNAGLNRFNTNLGKAREGSAKLQKAFNDLGVDMRQTTGAALEQTLAKLAGIKDGAVRAAAAATFFGERIGSKLAGALKDGIEHFNAFRASLDGIFTDEEAAHAEKLKIIFEQISRVMTKASATAVLDNAAAITRIGKAIALVLTESVQFIAFLSDFSKWAAEATAAKIGGTAVDDVVRIAIQLGDARRELARLSSENMKGIDPARIKAAADEVDRLVVALSKAEALRANAPAPPTVDSADTGIVGDVKDPAAALAKQKKIHEAAVKAYDDSMEAMQKIDQRREDERVQGIVDTWNQIDEVNKRKINEGAEAAFAATRDAALKADGELSKLTVFAEEAAKNMQDAFANFLFDPFQGGLKGMVTGFIDVIRRLVAEAAAADIFGRLGGLKGSGGFLGLIGSFFSGAAPHAAGGGSFPGGKPILVGERGPEMFVPSAAGSIIPNGAMGGVVINQNFTVGDVATRSQLVAGMSMAKDSAKKEIFELIRRGRV